MSGSLTPIGDDGLVSIILQDDSSMPFADMIFNAGNAALLDAYVGHVNLRD